MLDFYFTYRGVLRRLRSGALGHEMDRIAAHFFQLGYKRASAKIYISRLARFSEFAAGVIATGPITAGGGEGCEALVEGCGTHAAAHAQLGEWLRTVGVGECR
jgi:hypothetical protein